MNKLLLLIPLFVGCQEIRSAQTVGANTPSGSGYEHDVSEVEEVKKHVRKFYLKMGQAGLPNYERDIVYKIVDAYSDVYAGMCYYSSRREVHFNARYWNSFSDLEREMLVFHELGHCVLNRDHRGGLYKGSVPASLMYPSMNISEANYQEYSTYYINELFAPLRRTSHQLTVNAPSESKSASHRCSFGIHGSLPDPEIPLD